MLGPYEKITLADDSILEVRVENDKLIIPVIIPPASSDYKYAISEVAIRGDLIRQLTNNDSDSDYPIESTPGSRLYVCPKCKSDLLYTYNTKHCGQCGQKLNWSKIVEVE